MSRVPIRLRITFAFAAAMAVLLAGLGLFLHSQLRHRLDESIDNGLRSRASEVVSLARNSRSGLDASPRLIETDESFAQVLTPSGRVVDSTAQLQGEAVLDRASLERAAGEVSFFERDGVPGIEGRARLFAAPVQTSSGELIAVVGTSLGDRNEALTSLARLLLIGGPAALLIASLVGYLAAAAALRPVEAMRAQAAAISAGEPGGRLDVPEAGDELSRLANTLNAMLTRLEAALERERRFVDDASHELRTPLALHKTELELALQYGKDEGELRVAIGSAAEEIDRLIQLAEDLLVVARSGEGDLAIAPERLQATDLLETVGQRFRARAERSNRRLRVEGAPGLTVHGDRLRLEQALTNMVDNALRHSEGEVRVWAHAEGDRVRLHVGDRGPGFPPEFIEHAFDRFSRADAARARGGSGLGLAIVETIARAHGGAAGAQNAPGGGADVWIELRAS